MPCTICLQELESSEPVKKAKYSPLTTPNHKLKNTYITSYPYYVIAQSKQNNEKLNIVKNIQ